MDKPAGRFELILKRISGYNSNWGWLSPISNTVIYVILTSFLTVLVRTAKTGTEKVCDILQEILSKKIASKNLQRIYNQDMEILKLQDNYNIFSNIINRHKGESKELTEKFQKLIDSDTRRIKVEGLALEENHSDIEFVFTYARAVRDDIEGATNKQLTM